MKSFIRLFSLTLIILFSNQVSWATHIVGGNITYRCLGNNRYQFKLTIRRDCEFGQEPFDRDLHLTIYNGEGGHRITLGKNGYVPMRFLGVVPVDSDLDGGCIDQGKPVCVEEGTYVGEVVLPPTESTGYILSYQRCCRNWTLNNIETPLETGTTYFAKINPETLSICNSSPEFKQWAPIYICSGLPFTFDHSATDADGDSLVYSLCAPYQGLTFAHPQDLKADPPPYEPVVWKAPYGLADLLGGVPLKIDENSGIMTATPNTIGQFLVGVCVQEYRDGKRIGVSYRDFEFNVRACGEKPLASFKLTSDPCDGLTQTFMSTSKNANNYLWFFDADGDRTKRSSEENPTFTFDSAGTYKVLLKVDKDGCMDSTIQIITIIDPEIDVNFEYTLLCTDTLGLRLNSISTSKDSLVAWNWTVTDPKGTYTASGSPALVLMKKGVQVHIKLEVEDMNGCKGVKELDTYLPNINIEWTGDSLNICRGDSIRLFKFSKSDYNYTWSPTTGLNLKRPDRPIASPDSNTTYHVTITNDTCSLVDSVHIEVHDTIPVWITGTDTTCDGQVLLVAHSNDSTQFEWSYNDSFNPIVNTGDTLRIEISGDTVLFVRAGAADQCQGVASRYIVYGGRNVHIPKEHILCYGGGELFLNPDGDTTLTYLWTPGKYLDDSTKANPKATVDHSVTFKVQIHDPEFPQCEMQFEVEVKVGPKFIVHNLPVDTILCDADSLELDVDVTPDGGLLTWCDSSGKVIGEGNPVVILPNDSVNYVLKIADSLGCVTRDSIFVRSYDKNFDIVFPSDVCAGDSVMMQVVCNGGGNVQIDWDLGGNLTFIDKKVFVRPSKDKHSYKVTVRYGDGCVYTEQINLVVHGFDDDEVVASADPPRIVVGLPIQLDVVPKGYTYRWMPPELLDDSSSPTPIATLSKTGAQIFKVIVTDEFGCMGMDTVLVTAIPLDCEKGVFLPNAFSPNGDGVNDILFVRSAVIQEMDLVIYNRWGEKVFHTTNQGDGWDGTYKGTVLPPDVYNYLLKYTCINGEDYQRIGNISIILH